MPKKQSKNNKALRTRYALENAWRMVIAALLNPTKVVSQTIKVDKKGREFTSYTINRRSDTLDLRSLVVYTTDKGDFRILINIGVFLWYRNKVQNRSYNFLLKDIGQGRLFLIAGKQRFGVMSREEFEYALRTAGTTLQQSDIFENQSEEEPF
jgi:hypothetical protein